MLQGKTVVLGVTGSIAAYKIANLTSMLTKLHADVHVLMTENATNFINPITFETLTNHKCLVDTFDRNFNYNIEHVALGEKAEALLQKRKYNLVLVSSTNLDSIMEFFQHTPKGMHFICDTYQVEVILTAMRGMEPMGNYP